MYILQYLAEPVTQLVSVYHCTVQQVVAQLIFNNIVIDSVAAPDPIDP
jgi:hypothetical protein